MRTSFRRCSIEDTERSDVLAIRDDVILMGYIQGEGRSQATLFSVVLDDLAPADHMCHVIAAFVEQLDMGTLGFERALPAETGR
jgi:hypothetical protein